MEKNINNQISWLGMRLTKIHFVQEWGDIVAQKALEAFNL